MSRLVGVDHGSRRIGLAVGDTETGLAFARPALRRRNADADVAAIGQLARTEGAERIVLGLPRNMDGSEGPQAAAARAFGERLAAAIGLAVVYVDERLSSWEAGERLAAAGRRPRRASGELDSAAARLILQEYLDALHRPDPPAAIPQEAE
ncbi:MAG: Holliday junction resolvase RuvX [Candidatus Limnocylindria bacterium]